MFADAAKIIVKTATIALVTAVVIAAFALIQIPEPDLAGFTQAIGMGKAFVAYWIPGYNVILTFFGVILTAQLTILLLRIALVSYRWIFKVNE